MSIVSSVESDTKTKWYASAICIFLIVFRDFDFLRNPTFWADEGTFLYPKALQYGIQSLWMTHSGYYQLPQLLVCWVVSLFSSLEYAPVYTAWISILFCSIAPLLLIWGKSSLQLSFYYKLWLAILTVIACEDGNSYSTMNYHFILCWVAIVIFLEDVREANLFKVLIYAIFIGLATTSGPLPGLLVPFWAFKWWKNRTSADLILFIVSSVGLSISFYHFIYQYLQNDPSIHKNRFVNISPSYSLVRFYLMGLIGNSIGYFEALSRIAALASWWLFFYSMKSRFTFPQKWMSILLVLVYMCVPFLLSGSMAGGSRYLYCANLLFAAILLSNHQYNNHIWSYVLVIAISLAALISYKPKHEDMTKLKPIDWKTEVKKWRKDPTYPIKIYPYDGWDTTKAWTIHLKPTNVN